LRSSSNYVVNSPIPPPSAESDRRASFRRNRHDKDEDPRVGRRGAPGNRGGHGRIPGSGPRGAIGSCESNRDTCPFTGSGCSGSAKGGTGSVAVVGEGSLVSGVTNGLGGIPLIEGLSAFAV
jgi:hypothetical protein